jgi:hypothetical protein
MIRILRTDGRNIVKSEGTRSTRPRSWNASPIRGIRGSGRRSPQMSGNILPRSRTHVTVFAAIDFLAPGLVFSTTGRYSHCMRISCGHNWEPRIEKGLRVLGALAVAALARK